MNHLPIEAHGLIGDLRTAALISREGEIDWCCLPDFDSPSVFASLLDPERGGRFRIAPRFAVRQTQLYDGETAILRTVFFGKDYELELLDFMPVATLLKRWRGPDQAIFRLVSCRKGHCDVEFCFEPRPEYARSRPVLERRGNHIITEAAGLRLICSVGFPLQVNGGKATGVQTLQEGDRNWCCLQITSSRTGHGWWEDPLRVGPSAYESTRRFWMSWIKRSSYGGRYEDVVSRSLITLKLLTHQDTGAIVAAPTTSLPSILGGECNWDYRFTWLRDAALSLAVFLQCGLAEEAEAFFGWLLRVLKSRHGALRPIYTIRGDELGVERTLDHFVGYAGSRPVRVGNGASRQFQLDVYGEVLDAFHQFVEVNPRAGRRIWVELHHLLKELENRWEDPDVGIWELGGQPRHLVHSKVMAWVGFDRAIDLLDPLGRGPGLFRSLSEGIREMVMRRPSKLMRWQEAKGRIKRKVLTQGWSHHHQAFTRAFGDDALDASVLTLTAMRFLSPLDPRVAQTRRLIQQKLSRNRLLLRYCDDDGLNDQETPFLPCSCWLVQDLLWAGCREEAAEVFQVLLDLRNPAGLYAEGVEPASGSFRGNFPQAYTHLGVIQCALALDRSSRNGD